jgi:CHAD domain-containing protein
VTKARKWIEPISSTAPVDEIAAEALRSRLMQIWTWQRRLGNLRGEHAAKAIHQLRVSARRAQAALECFSDLLPQQRSLEIGKLVRRARKAAGQARDLDVLMHRIREDARQSDEVPWGKLITALRKRRRKAEHTIHSVCRRFQNVDYPRQVKDFVKRVRPRRKVDRLLHPTFTDAGRHSLRNLLGDFFQVADGDLSHIEALHACRILGKMLRYGMEIFAPAMASVLREKAYPVLVQLQEKLGAVNDHAVALDFLIDWRAKVKSEPLKRLIQEREKIEQMGLAERRLEVLAWWTPKIRQMMKDYCLTGIGEAPVGQAESPSPPAPIQEEFAAVHGGV